MVSASSRTVAGACVRARQSRLIERWLVEWPGRLDRARIADLRVLAAPRRPGLAHRRSHLLLEAALSSQQVQAVPGPPKAPMSHT